MILMFFGGGVPGVPVLPTPTLSFKEWLIATINADTTLQGYLKDTNGNMNVYPTDVDLQPEQFPAITISDVGITVLSIPQGMHVGSVQLNIWSIINAMQVESIYYRLQTILNFQNSITSTVSISGTLWWIRENGARDLHTPGRRLWHKAVDLKAWFTKVDRS